MKANSHLTPNLKLTFQNKSKRKIRVLSSLSPPPLLFREPKKIKNNSKQISQQYDLLHYSNDMNSPNLNPTILETAFKIQKNSSSKKCLSKSHRQGKKQTIFSSTKLSLKKSLRSMSARQNLTKSQQLSKNFKHKQKNLQIVKNMKEKEYEKNLHSILKYQEQIHKQRQQFLCKQEIYQYQINMLKRVLNSDICVGKQFRYGQFNTSQIFQ